MAAPAAVVRATACGDKREGTLTVRIAPGLHVAVNVNGIASWPREGVKVGNLRARVGLKKTSRLVQKRDSGNIAQRGARFGLQRREKFLHGGFTFAENNHVCASVQIFAHVGAGFRAAYDSFPSSTSREFQYFDHALASHQIGVDTQDGRCCCLQMVLEVVQAGESCVEDLDGKTLRTKMRANVQEAKRNVGLEDLHFFRILVEKVAVREQQISHWRLCRAQ